MTSDKTTKLWVCCGVFISILACSSSVLAQACPAQLTCQWTSLNPGSGCNPPEPATAYNSFWDGPWEEAFTVQTNFCPATPSSCMEAPTSSQPSHNASCGQPIDLADGNTWITQTDVKIPGLGGGLSLARSWNSIWSQARAGAVGLFGAGWSSTFEENVFVGSDHYMKYARGAGDVWSFGFSGRDTNGNPLYSVAGRGSLVPTLAQMPTSWVLTFQNGEQRIFDGTTGRLQSITDRNGNTTQLTYDASFRLVMVTDPVSRHLYFSYASPSSFLVTGVTSDFGISLSYTYDSMGRLTQCTRPDSTTVSFQYNDPNPSLITAVLDSNGKVLESHTYNSCAQGVTASRAGGVEAVTVSYPLACHSGLALAP